MKKRRLVIIGGGPAGLAAAVAAYDSGIKDVLIIERGDRLGGILLQCIHNGFGLHRFKESLTGPEYAQRFIDEAIKRNIEYYTDTTVLNVSDKKEITFVGAKTGVTTVKATAIILAMGCRERSRGALNIAGSRPAGIYSAGTVQKYINVKGYMPGKRVVILGSGDIGLIMARRLTLEGAKVLAVCEIMPFSSGLKRNIEQCLNDFNIPLYLNHTITEIRGKDRVSGVTVSEVDKNKKPIAGTEMSFDCDTVLFSVGLIPENELSKTAGIELSPKTKGAIVDENRQTSINGVFACGNVLHVHDLVDYVSEEAEIAGKAAADYVLKKIKPTRKRKVVCGENVGYVVPQEISFNSGDVKLFFRVKDVVMDGKAVITVGGMEILSQKKPIFTPGEMQTVILRKYAAGKLNGDIELKVVKND